MSEAFMRKALIIKIAGQYLSTHHKIVPKK